MKKDRKFFLKVKKLYFSMNDIEATKMITREVFHCCLSDDDISWMARCIKAFFEKNDHREVIKQDEKRRLLHNQSYRCAICGAPINEKNMHVDHVIPWDYVGDRLSDNLQGLCSDCNLSKSSHVAVALSNLILHLEG